MQKRVDASRCGDIPSNMPARAKIVLSLLPYFVISPSGVQSTPYIVRSSRLMSHTEDACMCQASRLWSFHRCYPDSTTLRPRLRP